MAMNNEKLAHEMGFVFDGAVKSHHSPVSVSVYFFNRITNIFCSQADVRPVCANFHPIVGAVGQVVCNWSRINRSSLCINVVHNEFLANASIMSETKNVPKNTTPASNAVNSIARITL
jgi:hypothetical protein